MKNDIVINDKRTNIEWNDYLASAYAEGFCEGENATAEEILEAWSYLIRTKLCYKLQGWYGRQARTIIESGFISEDGTVDWELFDESKEILL